MVGVGQGQLSSREEPSQIKMFFSFLFRSFSCYQGLETLHRTDNNKNNLLLTKILEHKVCLSAMMAATEPKWKRFLSFFFLTKESKDS